MYEELMERLRFLSKQGKRYGMAVVSFQEAADAIEELQKDRVCRIVEHDGVTELSVVPRWIPVTERLPEDGEWVLVWGYGQKIPIMMFRQSGAWIDDQFEFHTTVTHWMPIPQPPKEET